MRHPRNQLLLLLLLPALRLQRRLQPRGHFVHSLARGLKFVLRLVRNGGIKIPVLNPFYAGDERVQRLLNVPEQVLCQIEICEPDRREKRQKHTPAVNRGEELRAILKQI